MNTPADKRMNHELEGLETHRNLKQGFASEAGTTSRYLYFARIADIEGSPETATIFRELAESSACNGHGFLDFLKRAGDPETDLPIGETERNLIAAISAETREFSEIYPRMKEVAALEGLPDIENWLLTLGKLKKVHTDRLKGALAQFNALHEK